MDAQMAIFSIIGFMVLVVVVNIVYAITHPEEVKKLSEEVEKTEEEKMKEKKRWEKTKKDGENIDIEHCHMDLW